MPTVKAPIEVTLKPGVYDSVFRGIEEKTGKDLQTGEDRIYWQWHFGTRTKSGELDLIANSSANFGGKAKARGWAEAILGRAIKPGEDVDLDKLIGLSCRLVLTTKEIEKVGLVNRIESVVAMPTAEDDEEETLG